jgi:hypothetical protein
VEVLDDEIIPVMANPAALRYHHCTVFDDFLGHPLREKILGIFKFSFFKGLSGVPKQLIALGSPTTNEHVPHMPPSSLKNNRNTIPPIGFKVTRYYKIFPHFPGIVMWVGGDRYCYLFWDITGRKLTEHELERTKELLEKQVHDRTRELQDALAIKSNFLAIMSHGTLPIIQNSS